MQGIRSTVAEWQPCRAILAGTFLYILESESAHSYQRCIRYFDPRLPCTNALVNSKGVFVPFSSISFYTKYVAGHYNFLIDRSFSYLLLIRSQNPLLEVAQCDWEASNGSAICPNC